LTAYIVAQLCFKDRVSYDRYQQRFIELFQTCDGMAVIADESPVVIEGHWDWEKLVVLSFPDSSSACRFMTSPAYQEISKDRIAGADAVVILANGLPQNP